MMLNRHIILYDKNDTECDSMGIAILDEHIKDDLIRETMNSNYTFEFMIEHEYANLLEGRSIIKAPTRQGDELFRVRLVERNTGDDGYSYVYCVQLFYCDMEDRLIEELELNDVTGSTALTMMSQSTDAPHNFTFYSDIDDAASSYYYRKPFATALIGDLDESFVNLWGGELEVNKWNVKMHKSRGKNRGVKVRYRDNMTGLNATHDYSPVITRLYPMSADGITLDEKYVDSPLIDPNHPITKPMVFDYIYLTQDDGSDGGYLTEAEVKAAIKEMAEDMFSVGNIDKPESRYDVSLEELCRTREASHYAVLDYIFIGDTVEIHHEDWGVDISTRLIEYTYRPKIDRYLVMTLGTVTGTFSTNTQRTQESILNKIETNKQTIQGQLNDAVEHLTSLIQAGTEGHVVITKNEILIMDTTDPATAVEVWRFNSGGIGYSNTGYNGPFIGLTKDGKLVVNEATAHTLSASIMKTGLLQSADGKSWWNFDNGHFSWADGAFSFDGELVKLKIDGTNLSDVLDKTFTIVASHENQVVPVTSEGKAIGYGDYLFEFTIIQNYSGTEAPCMVTKITPKNEITGVKFLQNENTCSMIVNKGTNLSANPDEYFDVELTTLDYVLTKRITWCTVVQGVDGTDGIPGQTLYTWIRYADDAQGGGISNSPNGKTYVGFAYNKTTPTESNRPSDYTWSLMKGNDGLKGEDGKDGNPNYTWIKYSDNSNGENMYNIPHEFTGYIGIAVNKDTPTEGTDPSEYTWSKFRGEDGTDGQPGPTLYTWIRYADDAQGNGISNSPEGKEYIGFAYNKTSQYESNTPEDYMWSLIKGTDGQPGLDGKDGNPNYTWIKYSDNANGSGMYDTPKASTMYIGIAINKTTSQEGTNPAQYTWSKFRGDDGVDGTDGKDGVTQKHNLIKNSAFFKGQSGWTLTANASLDYENKYGDHPTVHVVGNGITSSAPWYGIASTTNTTITEFKEGVTYTLSYYYYVPDVTLFDANLTMTTPTSTAFGFNIEAIDTDGTTTYLGTSANISGVVEGLWTKYTTSFTAKKNYKVGRVKFGLAANGEVWATDFKLEENVEASDWCGTADETIGQDGVDGQPGHDAQTASIVASSTVFKSTDGGVTFRPGSITLTPLYQNVSHSKWLYSTNNGTSWITISNNGVSGISLNGQAVAISYDCKLFTNSITTVQFKVISANASVYDVITITKISERADLNDTLATMEMTINQSNTAWQAAFKTSSANNLLKNSDAKFGTENWITNGGGIAVGKANAFPFYGYVEPYFGTSFPSGIKYAEDIILEPNTDYVYEGYVYVNGSITPGNRTPLHFWCYTTNSGTVEACDIIDYRQNLVSGRFVKCYVHFKTTDVKSNIYFRALVYSTSTVDHVGVKRLSLKKANRETEWCQHPNEVATAAVTISENGLKATHSEADTYTVMNARGNAIYDVETGEALAWMSAKKQWTEAKFDYVYAKNIVNCYTGDYTLYVNHSHTGPSLGTSENPFSSFADLKNHLPENTIITQDLHIIVRDPGFVIHEPLILWRISGNGYIRIELEGTLVIDNDYHAIELIQINTWVWIRSGRTDVNSATTGAVLVARASNVDGTNCIRACDVSRLEVDRLTMVNTNGTAIKTERTDLYTYCCDFGNSNGAVLLRYQSIYYSSSDCGSCSTFTTITDASKAYWGHSGSPIRPIGDCYAPNGIFFNFANCATKASARYSGSSAPSAPSGNQNYTQSFNHTALQTYQYSWNNWSTDGSCKQGSWGYGRRGGHMFFDINAIRSFLSGTVADGNTITLTRANSGGLNAQSNVYLCGSTCSSASGAPSYSNRTHIGTIGWGEKKTFSIPLAIVQSLKSGTCSSLAIHVDSDARNDYINITSASITLKCKK